MAVSYRTILNGEVTIDWTSLIELRYENSTLSLLYSDIETEEVYEIDDIDVQVNLALLVVSISDKWESTLVRANNGNISKKTVVFSSLINTVNRSFVIIKATHLISLTLESDWIEYEPYSVHYELDHLWESSSTNLFKYYVMARKSTLETAFSNRITQLEYMSTLPD